MIAQQVDSTSFEEETPWTYLTRRKWISRTGPGIPMAACMSQVFVRYQQSIQWKALAEDRIARGQYLGGHFPGRLLFGSRAFLPAEAAPAQRRQRRVRASLHGSGGMIAGPVSLGDGTADWRAAEVLLTAKRSVQNATLTSN